MLDISLQLCFVKHFNSDLMVRVLFVERFVNRSKMPLTENFRVLLDFIVLLELFDTLLDSFRM
jgi:hypothetical protein